MNEGRSAGGGGSIGRWFSRLLTGIIDLLYPPTCALCGNISSKDICAKCWSDFIPVGGRVCATCGNPAVGGEPCPFCLAMEFHFDKAFSFFAYEEPLRDAILDFKYHLGERKGRALTGLFADEFIASPVSKKKFDIIVPVPLTGQKLRRRSYNQSEIFAYGIADAISIPVVPYALLKRKETPSQTGFDLAQRVENVSDSFMVPDQSIVEGKRVLLVDDIITTGATMNECAKVLKESGAREVVAISLARGIMKG
jgi:competence protein ComFC